jgi:hypothetical protein
LPPYGPEFAVPNLCLVMDVLQCFQPADDAGDAAALAASPAVPMARTVATPAPSMYRAGLFLSCIPMLTPRLFLGTNHRFVALTSAFSM